MSDTRIEAAARALASVEPGEDWPTNEALGGSLTGTRDDEYRDGMREQAEDALVAADAADQAQGIRRMKFNDEILEHFERETGIVTSDQRLLIALMITAAQR